MKRYICILSAAVMLFSLASCDALNTQAPVATTQNAATPTAAPDNTPVPTVEPSEEAIDTPLPLETEAPTPAPLPNVITGASTEAEIVISGEKTAINLKRQESSLGYVIYVWEDRFAYKADASVETFTLDWKGMKLPEVSVRVELIKNKSVDDVAESTVKDLAKKAPADNQGKVTRPAYMMDATLVRRVEYGDYEVFTDVYIIDNNNGGVFKVTASYFPEAIEDVGQAIVPMLNSFQLQEMIK